MQLRTYRGSYFVYLPSGIVSLLSVHKADKVLVIPHRFQLLNAFNEVVKNKIEIIIVIEKKIIRGYSPIRKTLKLTIPSYLVNLFNVKVGDELTPVLVEAQSGGAILQIMQTMDAPLTIPEFMNLNFDEIIKYLNPKNKKRKIKDIQAITTDFAYATDTPTYSNGFQSDILDSPPPEIASGGVQMDEELDLIAIGGSQIEEDRDLVNVAGGGE